MFHSMQVDGHFARSFSRQEIYEIHGSLEQWQCGAKDERQIPCQGRVWPLPSSYRFQIDRSTMRAQEDLNASYIMQKENSITRYRSFLKCPKCKSPARPNVLMFRDKQWISNDHDTVRNSEFYVLVMYI